MRESREVAPGVKVKPEQSQWAWLLMAAGFVLLLADVLFRQGLAAGAPQILVVLSALALRSRVWTVRLGLVASVFAILGLLPDRPGIGLAGEIMGRTLVVCTIWAIVFVELRWLSVHPRENMIKEEGEAVASETAAWTPEAVNEIQRAFVQSELIHGAVHSANNMLMVAESSLDQVREASNADPQTQAAGGDLDQAIKEIGQAIEALHSAAKEESGGVWPINLTRMVQDAAPIIRYLLPKTIRLVLPDPSEAGMEVPGGRWLHALLGMCLAVRDAGPAIDEVRVTLVCDPMSESSGRKGTATLTVAGATVEGRQRRPEKVAAELRQTIAVQTLSELAEGMNGSFQWEQQGTASARAIIKVPCAGLERSEKTKPKVEVSVILADPNDYARSILIGALRKEGWNAVGATTLRQALELKGKTAGRTVLVLDDALWRGGAKPVERIEHQCVIVLQGSSAEQAGAVQTPWTLNKPFQSGELTALITTALEAEP